MVPRHAGAGVGWLCLLILAPVALCSSQPSGQGPGRALDAFADEPTSMSACQLDDAVELMQMQMQVSTGVRESPAAAGTGRAGAAEAPRQPRSLAAARVPPASGASTAEADAWSSPPWPAQAISWPAVAASAGFYVRVGRLSLLRWPDLAGVCTVAFLGLVCISLFFICRKARARAEATDSMGDKELQPCVFPSPHFQQQLHHFNIAFASCGVRK